MAEAAPSAALVKEGLVRARLAALDGAVVAYSGGVDSSYLLALAVSELGARALALTAVSASVLPEDVVEATALARRLGARHRLVDSAETSDPRYAANPTNRCYFCKTELYDLCRGEAQRLGIGAVVSGTNADELSDWRPGLAAADEHGVVAPLAEAGMTKAEIRERSRALGLPTWDKPQSPCLSSRIPYGVEVTPERLRQIGAAERAMRSLGLRVFRVRYHGELARLEVAADELPALLARSADATRLLRAAGFKYAVVDLEPFRSGRLNEAAGLVRLGGSRASAG